LNWWTVSGIMAVAYAKSAEQFRHQGQPLARCRHGFFPNETLNQPCRLKPAHAGSSSCQSSRLRAGKPTPHSIAEQRTFTDVRDWLRQRDLTCPPAFMRGGGIHDDGLDLERHIKAEFLKKSALVGSDDKS
jgi:hypothetical protein